MVLRDLGLDKSSPVVTLVAKPVRSRKTFCCWQGAKPLNANYLSQDRPDLSFAAGSLARGMKSPTTNDLE